MKTVRQFVIGNKAEGYDVANDGPAREPWVARVWQGGRIVYRSWFPTKREAVNYCHARYRHYRGTGLKVHLRSRRTA